MQAQTFEIQCGHPSIATADPFAFLALEERGGSLERVQRARLRAKPRPLPIPEQLHHVVLGALDPLIQLVTDARGDRVAPQIFPDALRRILALQRVQDRQAEEDLQGRKDGRVVVFVVVFNVLASGG